MPSHIGQLKSLQQLTQFIVGQKSGLRICELGELSDIRGTLDISNMENVACAKDALQANMKDKKHLDELALNWSDKIADGVIQSGVIDHILNNLQPHPNLKQIKIRNYPGVILPHWLGDRSFSNLLQLELWGCENCSSLPPLGLLTSLQHLRISRMTGIEKVGSEFYRGASSSNTIKPYFRSLQTLRFEYMYEWEKWLRCGCRPGEFPRLRELYIIHCPKLTGKLPKQFRCLKNLVIKGCPQLLVASLKVPAISELTMWKFGELRLRRPASGFTALQTSDIEISDVSQSLEKCDLSSTLQSLGISYCNKVEFLLPELLRCHHPFLQKLWIFYCTCESLSLSFSLADPASLNYLEIRGCPDLEYIELPALDSACYKISHCLNLKLLAHTLSSLRRLELRYCPNLLFRGLPSNLRELTIWECNELTPEVDWGLQRLASLTHLKIVGAWEDLESFPKDCLLPSVLDRLSFSASYLSSKITHPHVPWVPVPLWSSAPYLPHRTKNLGLPRLQSLTQAGLQHLTSLETLSIQDCPKLQYLTKERLPDSLCCLSVNNCPLLEQRCQFEKGQEWCYIAHIPQVEINGVLMWASLIFSTYFFYAGMGKPGRYSKIEFKRLSRIVVSKRGFSSNLQSAFLEKFACRALALSSLEELRISNFLSFNYLTDVPFSGTSMTIYKRAGPILMKVPLHQCPK
ncbi:hypothetical protein AAG906_025678 [Vitis piasezkii]